MNVAVGQLVVGVQKTSFEAFITVIPSHATLIALEKCTKGKQR
jgi:hypothetical protein